LTFSILGAVLASAMATGRPPGATPEHERTVVPLQFHSGRPVIVLALNGKGPYRFLFDTGSGARLIVDEELAAGLGLKPAGTQRIGDPNTPEAIEAKVVKVARVELGALAIKDVDAISWNRGALGPADSPRGVVGLGLFGSSVVTLDYPGAKFIVEPGPLPEADGRTVLKATFEDGIPSIPIDVAGVGYLAHLDSGSTGFLGLPLGASKDLPLEAEPVVVGRARTASGDYAVSEARLSGYVRVGEIVLEGPRLRFVDLPSANLGSDLLRSMVVSVDRKNERVRLVASGKPIEPSERPRLGILMYGPKEGRLPIERVVPGSPAEAADLRAGDQIVTLNGRVAAEMSKFELSQMLLARPLAITLLRDGATVAVEISVTPPAADQAPPTGGH